MNVSRSSLEQIAIHGVTLTNPFAIIKPIPLDPPVTKTFLPATENKDEGDGIIYCTG